MKRVICLALFFMFFVGFGEAQPCLLSQVPVQNGFDEEKVNNENQYV